MLLKEKNKKVIRVPLNFYNSKSFFIRFYAYLPFIYALKNLDFNKS